MKKYIYLFFLFVLSIRFSQAQTINSRTNVLSSIDNNKMSFDSQKIPFNKNVIKGVLPNGFTYYIEKNTEPQHRAEIRLVENVGSVIETPAQLGIAHFIEHMAFEGTTHFKQQSIVHLLEQSGVTFGADLNAETGFDQTIYQMQVPTDTIGIFDTALQIAFDWTHLLNFDTSAIRRERGIITEEWRLGRGAQARLRDKFLPVLLEGSQYANRLPIGTYQSIQNMSRDQMISFYRNWYQPQMQSLIVVGDIDPIATQKKIWSLFSGISKPAVATVRPTFFIPERHRPTATILTDPEQIYNIVELFYFTDALPEATINFDYKNMIIRSLFDMMLSNRLKDIAEDPNAPYIYAGASYGKFLANRDALTLVSVAKNAQDVKAIIDTLMKSLQLINKFGFIPAELERAKKTAFASIEQLYNERSKISSGDRIQELIDNYINKEPVPGIAYEYQLYKRYLPTITLADVNSLINNWLHTEYKSLLVMSPQKDTALLPSPDSALALLSKVYTNLKPYKEATAIDPIITHPIQKGSIVNEQSYPNINITVLRLSNGAKVVLKPTKFKDNEILFSAVALGGSSVADDNDFLSANYADNIIQRSGIGKLSAIELRRKMAGKNCEVFPFIDRYTEGLQGNSTVEDLSTAFELLYSYFHDPRVDINAFITFKQELLVSIANRAQSPNAVLEDSIKTIMSDYNTREKVLSLQDMQYIDMQKALRFYKDELKDASKFVFTFVGNFTIDNIKPFIEKYIASLPATTKHTTWVDRNIRNHTGIFEKDIYAGTENKASVVIKITGNYPYSFEHRVNMAQLISLLDIRLREVLREQVGEVYAPQAYMNYSSIPNNPYSITIEFGCAPQNASHLISLTYQLLDSLQAVNTAINNIEKVNKEAIRNLQIEQRNNYYWLRSLQNSFIYHLNPDDILSVTNLIRSFTQDKAREIAKQLLDSHNRACFVLYPVSYKNNE